MSTAVRYTHADRGVYREYYRADDRTVYCRQENFPERYAWYICSRDGEPSHEVHNITIVAKF